ncbi:unnamed protein product [Menidia menidia]|uniref:(Atlantic silverside) hypothetical protein n=1 Tax=Menidia menidia TaxID=238744 RepID=A0A8S4BLU3_9TELE|nr:unnamed protein product [Menidia menidia]
MRFQVVAVLNLTAAAATLLILRDILRNSFDAQDQEQTTVEVTIPSPPECSLSRNCPPHHFALHIRSGAANVVGPRICFSGKNIMSHVLNNVGPGINIVVVNGENGVVEKFGYLNINAGNPNDIVTYLKDIKPGMIVLVASFDDVATKLTEEMREIFVEMGSTLIRSVKPRDNWVFAGRAGTKIKSPFEKHVANDENTNVFEGWPEMVEVSGCFPKNLTEGILAITFATFRPIVRNQSLSSRCFPVSITISHTESSLLSVAFLATRAERKQPQITAETFSTVSPIRHLNRLQIWIHTEDMGVTHGKKRELTHRTPETHVNQPASMSQMHPSEQRRFSELEILSSQIQNEEESSTLIKPHKPLSPFNASRSHKALHKELQMTHKRRVAQEGKTELQRALEKRRWEQKIKARQDQEETKRNIWRKTRRSSKKNPSSSE